MSTPLLAGTGRGDITPRQPLFLIGYPHVPRIATGTHDPLYATALCLRAGAEAVVAVSADVLFVSPALVSACRDRISRRTGIPAARILIAATHTHSGPATMRNAAFTDDPVVRPPDPAYLALLTDGITEAACQAFENAQPAFLAATRAAISGAGTNRHDPNGLRDPNAQLLVVRDAASGAVTAVVVAYAMHPTVLHEDSTLVSADFPGAARRRIEDQHDGCRVVYFTAPAGDQSPRHDVRGQTFDEAERLGRLVADPILAAIAALPPQPPAGDATLGARQEHVTLPQRTFPPVADAAAALATARATYATLKAAGAPHGPVRTAECAVFGAEEQLTLARLQAEGRLAAVAEAYRRSEVQVLRLGPALLVGLPGELFAAYGLEIKRRSPVPTLVASLANGDLQGYVTTPDATGYEACLSFFLPEAGRLLTDKAVELASLLAH